MSLWNRGVGQLVKSSYIKLNFHSFLFCFRTGKLPLLISQCIHYCVGPSSASVKTGSQPYVPKTPSSSNAQPKLSGGKLKYCYLALGVISPVLENDHTSFEKLQRDLFLVIWDFQHTSWWLKSPITWYFFPYITDKSSRSSSPLNVSPQSVIPFPGTPTHSPHTNPLTLIVKALISLYLTTR